MTDLLGVAPFVAVSGAASWFAQGFLHRARKKKEESDRDDRLEIHRDELTFQLLREAREEATIARAEMRSVHEDNRRLRALEQHFFYFEQSLDHLDAILSAKTLEERGIAERNAIAFLNRMRRLKDARGALINEIQRSQSEATVSPFIIPPENFHE